MGGEDNAQQWAPSHALQRYPVHPETSPWRLLAHGIPLPPRHHRPAWNKDEMNEHSASAVSARLTYFYLCSYPLSPGSVIEPGNWGRFLRLYSLNDPNSRWLPLREYVFETVRLRAFPHLPSRLEAAFVCETLDGLADFKRSSPRPFDLAYEIELVDPNAAGHRGCLAYFDNPPPPQQWTIPLLEERADAYWSGANVQRPEVVTMSPLRVVARHNVP
jgi:hypothetical protein